MLCSTVIISTIPACEHLIVSNLSTIIPFGELRTGIIATSFHHTSQVYLPVSTPTMSSSFNLTMAHGLQLNGLSNISPNADDLLNC